MQNSVMLSEVCSSLAAISTKLSPAVRELALSLLSATSAAVQRLAVMPVRAGSLVEVRSGCVFVCRHATEGDHLPAQGLESCWLVFRGPSHDARIRTEMLDLTAVKAASEVASGQELAPLLENFHFFAPLREHLQEIAGLDGGLAGQLHNLYALTDHFPQQLCGDEIHSDTPMVIISEAPASLYLDLVLPHDPPPPNAWEVPAEGQRTHGTVRFVVLGRNLTYKGSPLVRIQR